MIRRVSGLPAAAIAAALWAALPTAASAAEYRFAHQPVEGQYIVVLKDTAAGLANESTHAARVPAVAAQVAAAYGASVIHSYEHVLRGFAIRASDAQLLRMLDDERIAYIEEDGIATASTTQSNPTWGIDRIDQRDWPINFSYNYTSTASGVHAYIIDTGVLATHTEFTGRIGDGFTSVYDSYKTSDCNGHGTHIAGTLGGTTYGVAKAVTIHPVRVLDCAGNGAWSQVIAGIDWTAKNHLSPAVANISLGGSANSSVDTAVAGLITSGVTVAVAAGNNYGDACQFSPARVASAITVGATRDDDMRADFSNFGTCVDLFAPGMGILSASIGSTSATATLSGTSMASPHVAGIAALYLAAHPTHTPAQVWAALKTTVTPSRVLGAGTGSPNLFAYSLTGTTAPLPDVPPPAVSLDCDGSDGGDRYSCTVSYTSDSRAAILWPLDDTREQNTLRGYCVYPIPPANSTAWVPVTVQVTVANRSGSTTVSTTFQCFTGGVTR